MTTSLRFLHPSLFAVSVALLGTARICSADMTDREVKEEMTRRASLFCPGFSTDRALPGINAIKVDAMRVLLAHKYMVCPDRRLGEAIGAVWNSRYGVLLWTPTNPKSVAVMAAKADTLTHTMDFPNELTVYDLDGKPLKGQVVPMFEPRDTFTHF